VTFRRALIAAAAAAVTLCWVGTAFATSSTVVVSEFRFRGPSGGNDEFIELYNLSSAPVDISGWKLNGSNNAGTTSTRATIPGGTILAAGCHYLLTNGTATTGYSGADPGDATFATGVTDDGGIAVLLPANAIVDMVGLSVGSAYKEGTPLNSLGTSNLDRGYERKPGGSAGSGADTDNNVADFQVLTPSAPQNMLSSCIGTAPTRDAGLCRAGRADAAHRRDHAGHEPDEHRPDRHWRPDEHRRLRGDVVPRRRSRG
jgi:predicted extracellular nuclease